MLHSRTSDGRPLSDRSTLQYLCVASAPRAMDVDAVLSSPYFSESTTQTGSTLETIFSQATPLSKVAELVDRLSSVIIGLGISHRSTSGNVPISNSFTKKLLAITRSGRYMSHMAFNKS